MGCYLSQFITISSGLCAFVDPIPQEYGLDVLILFEWIEIEYSQSGELLFLGLGRL